MCIRDRVYIGQTGRACRQRFKEHLPKNKLKACKSKYAEHLMVCNHNYTDFDTNCKPLHLCNKGRHMNAAEEFEIYWAFKCNPSNMLNDQLNFKSHSYTIWLWTNSY